MESPSVKERFSLRGSSEPTPTKGKHSRVEIVKRLDESGYEREYVVKRQAIDANKTRAMRELEIFKELKKLNIPNFIEMLDYTEAVEHAGTEMVYLLEKADITLAEVEKLSVAEFRGILFQIIMALNIAQDRARFVHGDLHLSNLMLQRSSQRMIVYDATTSEHELIHFYIVGDVVKLIDFGLSRIDLETGAVVYNEEGMLKSGFDPMQDLKQLHDYLPALSRKVDWTRYPRAKELYQRLRRDMCDLPAKELVLQPFFEPLRRPPRALSRAYLTKAAHLYVPTQASPPPPAPRERKPPAAETAFLPSKATSLSPLEPFADIPKLPFETSSPSTSPVLQSLHKRRAQPLPEPPQERPATGETEQAEVEAEADADDEPILSGVSVSSRASRTSRSSRGSQSPRQRPWKRARRSYAPEDEGEEEEEDAPASGASARSTRRLGHGSGTPRRSPRGQPRPAEDPDSPVKRRLAF